MTDPHIGVSDLAEEAAYWTAPLGDRTFGVHPDDLRKGIERFPHSPRLRMRLGEFLRWGPDPDLEAAAVHSERAIALSPNDYRPVLLRASIAELAADYAATEAYARKAIGLAPRYIESHWLLGVALLANGKLDESLPEFRYAAAGHVSYLGAALGLVANETRSLDALEAMTPNDAGSELVLARFLLDQGREEESVAVFGRIDRSEALAHRSTVQYLNALVAAGNVERARSAWSGLMDVDGFEGDHLWNGGFESDILVDFAQFDWSIRATEYARISIDAGRAHSGSRSLRIDFTGLETTRLSREIQQRARVEAGEAYRLEAQVLTRGLVAESPPRVYVSSPDAAGWTAASDPIPTGTTDWSPVAFEFTAPSANLMVRIGIEPEYSYEDPTHGTVWFDDVRLVPSAAALAAR